MKQPWWKRTISYFKEVPLERISSPMNPDLYVCLSQGRYQLCSNNAIYSFGDKYDNYWDTFAQLDVSAFHDGEILILGFGMGSIPYMLEKGTEFRANFTGVEYDEAVIYLFNKYLADEIRSPLEIIIAEASVYMALNERKYDIIAMDVFVDDMIPEQFLNEEFLTRLKNGLADNGLLIWNHLYHFERDRKATDTFLNYKFKKIFPEADAILTQGNKMLLNRPLI